MFQRLGRLATTRARLVLALTGLGIILAATAGIHATSKLKSAGFVSPNAPSQLASNLLDQQFGGSPNLILLVRANTGSVDQPAVAAAGRALAARVAASPDVAAVSSYWSTGSASLRSRNGTEALVLAVVTGSDSQISNRTKAILAEVSGTPPGPVTVLPGGDAPVGNAIGNQITHDLGIAESIAIPITLILLILAFGSLVAAVLPVLIGLVSIVTTLAVLWGLGSVTNVSIYALNLTTAMSLGLAIDYSLLMVSRYREELVAGRSVADAVICSVSTAGRTILFSAATVAAALAALLVFPVYFLRSFAYAGISVVILASVGALIILPSLLFVLGTRVNAVPVRLGAGRRPAFGRAESPFWRGVATGVMRHPVAAGLPVVLLLVVLGLPFLHVHFGTPDDRVLPTSAPVRQVGDALRTQFAANQDDTIDVVTTKAMDATEAAAYSHTLSSLPGVEGVSGPAGQWSGGVATKIGPAASRYQTDASSWFSAIITPDPLSGKAASLVSKVRHLAVPAGVTAYVGGAAASLVDQKHDLGSRLPLALILIVLTTLIVLWLFTGSVVLPLKALVLNVLSLSAVFGAMVWIFQYGHLSWFFGFTPRPTSTTMPLLLFCIAFGLSMDYEVFMLSRIKELHDSGTPNTEAVAGGLARTGRIITTAAALLAVTFFAFGTSKVSFIQMFGVGTGLAILVDATLIRGVLVPAFMRLLGEANWWSPAPLRRLHDRIGLSDAAVSAPPPAAAPESLPV